MLAVVAVRPAVETAVFDRRHVVGNEIASQLVALVDRGPERAGARLPGEADRIAQAGPEHARAAGARIDLQDRGAVDLGLQPFLSNVAEKGMEIEINRAAILEVDPRTGSTRVFGSGLRNPVGLSWEPRTGALWTAVNERDELGSDLVPDYMTSVKDGGFYGWPYSYYGQHVDVRVKPPRPDLVAAALVPDYALGPHTGSLGLTFYDATLLPSH